MPMRRVLIRGLMFVRGPRERPDRPVDPDWGIDEGEIDGGGTGGQLPVFPGRPGHGLPPSFPGFPERPGHGLPPSWPGRPERPVDPDWGLEEGLPVQPLPPIRPGRPGHPLPRPPIPVLQVLPIEEGMEVPTGAPHEPGCLVVVYVNKSSPKAIGWLQGEGELPEARESVPAPGRPTGHWVPVECDPEHAVCRSDDAANLGWVYVFEIGTDFGKLKPTPAPTR